MGAADVFVVGFGTNHKWTSKLIRRATDSWCSHTWIEYGSLTYGGIWTIHAQSDGIVKERMAKVWKKYPTFRRFELVHVSQAQIREAIGYAIEQLGTPYDYGVIGNGAKLWWWRQTGRYRSPRYNPRELHCSEFVTKVLHFLDIEGVDILDPELTHPGKLYKFMENHPNFKPV